MKTQNVTDAAFRKYGKVLHGYDCTQLLKEMEHTPVPEDVLYIPGAEQLEILPKGTNTDIDFSVVGEKKMNNMPELKIEVDEIGYNQPEGVRYPTENPFA